jgi:hypothetical protein
MGWSFPRRRWEMATYRGRVDLATTPADRARRHESTGRVHHAPASPLAAFRSAICWRRRLCGGETLMARRRAVGLRSSTDLDDGELTTADGESLDSYLRRDAERGVYLVDCAHDRGVDYHQVLPSPREAGRDRLPDPRHLTREDLDRLEQVISENLGTHQNGTSDGNASESGEPTVQSGRRRGRK